MVNKNIVISDPEHMQYANYSAQKISMYYKYLYILEKWFEEAGWELPLPCRTNFRDSWFHFKKLYERKDYIKIVQEDYALEEHLIRAVKDAIICYYQLYIKKIEVVYKVLRAEKLTEMITTENMDAIEEYAKRVNVSEKGWTLKLYGEMGNPENLKMFLQTVAYVYSRDVDQKKAAESLQVCLHRVKNYYSKLRLNGTEIHRPANEGEYMGECVKVFGEMMDCLEENHLEEGVHVLARFISEEIAAEKTGEEKA